MNENQNVNNNNNDQNKPKESKKKKILKAIIIVLVLYIVISTVVQMLNVKASANDLEDYPLQYYPLNEYDYYLEYSRDDITTINDESGNIVTYEINANYKRIPELNGQYNSTTYYVFVIAGNVIPYDNTNHYVQINKYYNNNTTPSNLIRKIYYIKNLENKAYKYEIIQTEFDSTDTTETSQKISIITGGSVLIEGTYVDTYPLYMYGVIITTNYQYGALMAQFYCDQENGIDIWSNTEETETETETDTEIETPLTEVLGTDEFTKTENTSYNHYTINNIVPKNWTDFYAGFIGKVQTAEGVSVPIYYNWAIDGMQYGDGTITVLDPAYHDYINEISITGSITNGTIELDASKEIEIVYFAISGDRNNLSTHLVEKVNEYQLAEDQLQEAYNRGYSDGYTQGVNDTQMGAFGNAELKVYFQFVEDSTGTVINHLQNFPFNVNTGGISFENVWTWYMNSEWNRSGITVYYVDFEIILYDTGVLWSNKMFRFGVAGDTITAEMMPYSVQVTTVETVETSETTGIWHNVTLIKSGNYYYLTNNELEGYHIDQIRFYINAQNLSYYDQLITNQLTLYNNLGEYTVNVKSFNQGYNNGFDSGYENGFRNGYTDGKKDGITIGNNEGYLIGKEEGYKNGYVIGKSDGLTSNIGWYDMMLAIPQAQIETYKGILEFEFFGVNIANFIASIITLALCMWIYRKVT